MIATFPLMVAVEEVFASINLHTSRGLADIIQKYFPRPILCIIVFLLLIANTINIDADLGNLASPIW